MADLKISQLTSATLPLAGTEVLPIVQSSSTKKVATDDLTVKNVRSNATTGILQVAGPGASTTRVMTTPDANFTAARTDAAQSFTGDQTLSTGNLVQGTAGKGIDFSANTPQAGMTSELLDWYEEGTFTPVPSGLTVVGTPTYTGYYTRIGRIIYFTMNIVSTTSTTSTADATTFSATGFPVIINAGGAFSTCTAVNRGNTGSLGVGQIVNSGGTTTIFTPTWTALANVLVSGFFITT